MTPYEYVCWEWLDKDGVPQYVGVGRVQGGVHPAERMWEDCREKECQLNDWLTTLTKEPERNRDITSMAMHKGPAKAYCIARREQLKDANFPLLSTREYGTSVGGGKARAVVSPEGVEYESVRFAADELGISPCTITRRCNSKSSEWKYL